MATMRLMVRLQEPEVLTRGRELAAAHAARCALDDERREVAADFRQRLDAADEELARLASAVRTGAEEREVEVRDVHDYRRGVIETLRADTGDIVATRAMRTDERQMPLAAVVGLDGKARAAGEREEPDAG